MPTQLKTDTGAKAEDKAKGGSITIILSIVGFITVCVIAFLIEHYVHSRSVRA